MTRLNKAEVRRGFSRAAVSYDQAAVVQAEIARRLLDRVTQFKLKPRRLLDLGCGTGQIIPELLNMMPAMNYYGLDFARPMLQKARNSCNSEQCQWICADIEQLPFVTDVFDLVMSASTLQWSENLAETFKDCLDMLADQGLFIFSTFGPDTLNELRSCFASIDPDTPHINEFADMHMLGDLLLACGFSQPVMETERLLVRYSHPRQLMKDLHSTGANNHANTRAKGLFGRQRMARVLDEYEKLRLTSGEYPATYEVIYGHAWKKQDEPGVLAEPQDSVPVRFYR